MKTLAEQFAEAVMLAVKFKEQRDLLLETLKYFIKRCPESNVPLELELLAKRVVKQVESPVRKSGGRIAKVKEKAVRLVCKNGMGC